MNKGPLQQFLERCLLDPTEALAHVADNSTLPPEVQSELHVGNLSEEFELRGLEGDKAELRDSLYDLMDKLYGNLNMNRSTQEIDKSCAHYQTQGKRPGVCITFTLEMRTGLLIVTAREM